MCSAAWGGGGQNDRGASPYPRTPTTKNTLRQRGKPNAWVSTEGVGPGPHRDGVVVGGSLLPPSSSQVCNSDASTFATTTTTPQTTSSTTTTTTNTKATPANGGNSSKLGSSSSSPSSSPSFTSSSPSYSSYSSSTSLSSSSTSPSSSSNSSHSSSGSRSSCCGMWMKRLMPNPRGVLMWPFSLQILLLTLSYCRYVTGEDRLNLIHARLVNMLRTKQSLFYRRQLRSGNEPSLDLRDHRLFISNPKLDCCPTVTEFEPRRTGINPSGIVLELFSNQNFTQSFYETICYPFLRNRPCQFVDPKLAYATRCVQQYSYVYAIGRTYGSNEGFRVDYIRIPAGCKCQIQKQFIRRRKKNVIQ